MAILSVALAVNNDTNQLLITDINSGFIISTLSLDYYSGDSSDIVVTEDRQKAYISSFGTQQIYEVSLADIYNPQILRTFNLSTTYPSDIVLSADENYLMTTNGNLSSPIFTVDLNTGIIAETTETNFQSIESSSDGTIYASSYVDNLITSFTIQSGNLVQINSITAPTIINLYTSSSNPTVVTALSQTFGTDKLIQYDSNLNQINEIDLNYYPQSGVFSPSGDTFYVLDTDGKFTAYAVDSNGIITTEIFQTTAFGGNESYFGIEQIALSSDGTKIFAGIGGDGLRVFDASNGVEQRVVSNVGEISGVAFLEDRLIVSTEPTQGNDVLFGDDNNNKIYGLGGSDLIAGNGGNDYLYGDSPTVLPAGWGNGNDSLYGDAGNDSLYGADGNDSLDGGSEDDYLNGGNGNDTFFGSTGHDTLLGGSGSDSLDGGSEDDWLHGGWGNDALYGGDGSDWLQGGMGNDNLTGGDGNDYFVVERNSGRDYIWDYTPGEDFIRLGSGLYSRGPNRNVTLVDTGSNLNILCRGEVMATVFGVATTDIEFG